MEIVPASSSPRRCLLLQAAGPAIGPRLQHADVSAADGRPVEAGRRWLSKLKAPACNEVFRPAVAVDAPVALDADIPGQPVKWLPEPLQKVERI